MENTYTYTARSARDPQHAVTFTLYDGRMAVDLTAPLEQVERMVAEAEGQDAEPESGEASGTTVPARFELPAWAKPVAVSLLRQGVGPFHIADVSAEATQDGLTVTGWVRAGGLRLARIAFDWDQVDNPDTAGAFVAEVRRRKDRAERPSSLPAPLDLWATWAAGLVVLAVFLVARRRSS
jgi:hypothetical protein